jgi:hypothetical protein
MENPCKGQQSRTRRFRTIKTPTRRVRDCKEGFERRLPDGKCTSIPYRNVPNNKTLRSIGLPGLALDPHLTTIRPDAKGRIYPSKYRNSTAKIPSKDRKRILPQVIPPSQFIRNPLFDNPTAKLPPQIMQKLMKKKRIQTQLIPRSEVKRNPLFDNPTANLPPQILEKLMKKERIQPQLIPRSEVKRNDKFDNPTANLPPQILEKLMKKERIQPQFIPRSELKRNDKFDNPTANLPLKILEQLMKKERIQPQLIPRSELKRNDKFDNPTANLPLALRQKLTENKNVQPQSIHELLPPEKLNNPPTTLPTKEKKKIRPQLIPPSQFTRNRLFDNPTATIPRQILQKIMENQNIQQQTQSIRELNQTGKFNNPTAKPTPKEKKRIRPQLIAPSQVTRNPMFSNETANP